MRKEIYHTIYQAEYDTTFIMKETLENGETTTMEVTGFYFGEPDDENTELFKNKRKATFTHGNNNM